MNILITGANGAMSYYLVDYIKRNNPGFHVAGIHRSAFPPEEYSVGRRLPKVVEPFQSKFCRLYRVDLAEATLSGLLSGIDFKPEIIFHLASEANVRESFHRGAQVVENNVRCTYALYEWILASSISPTVVLASTSEVYGNVPSVLQPIREGQIFAPINPYAVSKCTQEHIAHYFHKAHGIKTVITRAFGYINPRREDLVATSVARQLRHRILLYGRTGVDSDLTKIECGNLAPIRTFCDARDIAEAYWLAAIMCKPGCYNIGSETGITIEKLIRSILDIFVEKYCMSWLPGINQSKEMLRPVDIIECVPDCYKFKHATGWEPKIPLKESLEWLIETVR